MLDGTGSFSSWWRGEDAQERWRAWYGSRSSGTFNQSIMNGHDMDVPMMIKDHGSHGVSEIVRFSLEGHFTRLTGSFQDKGVVATGQPTSKRFGGIAYMAFPGRRHVW